MYTGLYIPNATAATQVEFAPVQTQIQAIEQTLSAHIGVAVLDTQNNTRWSYKGDERTPLTSTFKTLACAKLLHDAENNTLALIDTVTIKASELVTYSPVTEKWVGKAIPVVQACEATMFTSDNTAANIVIHAVGGPDKITAFLRQSGDAVTQLDRFEPALNEATLGDVRDTTTPNAMTQTLNTLLFKNGLSKQNQQQLIDWMVGNQVTGNLLRSVLPQGWTIADRSGAGGHGARSITAVVWPEDRAPVIIAIYVMQTEASFDARNQAIVTIGQAIFNLYQ
ncbi:beta-lactamase [Photobacterium aphoticum]|uniref:beta-lactamase n=1 Tax=Photobacterium aphoticum TaxID=754436 RepID=A0A0J1GNG3_9GAMM|nr:beta-lactamase [Photobacterium aphoticum]